MRPRDAEIGNGILLVKLPTFILSEGEIGAVIGKARKHDVLILDLRGNPGGTTDTVKLFVGSMFDHDVKIGDRVGREERKPMIAKSRHHFDGKLTVLVDSRSASAAELFARVMQIEKRGTLLGDVTSGSVMEAKEHGYQLGLNTAVFFAASITDADITMTDGKSLEHVGVTPDEILLPSSADLASGRDPVLSRAVELAGGKRTPEDAGKLFPYEWPKD